MAAGAVLSRLRGLAKSGGEGSRGGKVIGHTRSGKPIYEDHEADDASHRSWTHEDHEDAADAHADKALDHKTQYSTETEGALGDEDYPSHPPNHEAIEHHDERQQHHGYIRDHHWRLAEKLAPAIAKQDFPFGVFMPTADAIYTDLLRKAGEGTRGGKIIGHTKSGKPIYASHHEFEKNSKGFTSNDHKDAAQVLKSASKDSVAARHQAIADHLHSTGYHYASNRSAQEHLNMAKFHNMTADHHLELGADLQSNNYMLGQHHKNLAGQHMDIAAAHRSIAQSMNKATGSKARKA